MITTEEIKHLGSLARIELEDGEVASLAKEVDSILAYVGQIQEVSDGVERELPNQLRLRKS
jgi:aspartyl/glutamyl-tRNA(Asn/Gln) amidotransferase C subunit